MPFVEVAAESFSEAPVDDFVDIRRSLAGRNRNPLKVNLNICSDTMDVNQLAAAYVLFRGVGR